MLTSVAIIGFYPLYKFSSFEITIAVVTGLALATINFLLGYVSIEYSFEKSMLKFVQVTLGGMGVRLLLLLSSMFFFIKVFNFHILAFTITLLGFYFFYLIIEILYINKKVHSEIC